MAKHAADTVLERLDSTLSAPGLNRAILIVTLGALIAHFAVLWLGPQMIGSVHAPDFPLFVLFVFGGVPILAQLALKLLRHDIDADIIADE
ncbi:hypothetical protein ACQ0MK_11740 [Thalassospira lucentensis]|uniref:hypothetical protein n=1 Tax=Thalassospira lucentensis TaxID=168935 RepID=UPI003D2F2F1E